MHCPTCNLQLYRTELEGVAFNACPGCDGVWLDAEEFDRLVQRSGRRAWYVLAEEETPAVYQYTEQGEAFHLKAHDLVEILHRSESDVWEWSPHGAYEEAGM